MNVNSIVENITRLEIGIIINVGESEKSKKALQKRLYLESSCSCKNGKYIGSIIDDSVITNDKIIEETKTVPINFDEK